MQHHLKIFLIALFFTTSATFSCLAQQPALTNPFLPTGTATAATSPKTAAVVPAVVAPPSERISTYPLSYARAKDVQEALQSIFKQKLALDVTTNSIILCGTSEEHARLTQLLPKLDVATRQVTLEAKIIAISRENSRDLGVKWGWDTIPQRRESTTSDSDSDSDSNYDGSFKFWRGYAFRFNATLSALIANGKARILATPRIITIPGQQASIFIGDHIPVQTEKHDSSGSYTATEYLDAGIKLEYAPIISCDGKMVTARVHTEVSTPVLISELKNYRITSRTADTNVRMYSGETLVIGGLISEEQQRSIQKVPFLSKIPILGELFINRSQKNAQSEVLLLLTPHITEAGASPAIYSEAAKLINSNLDEEK